MKHITVKLSKQSKASGSQTYYNMILIKFLKLKFVGLKSKTCLLIISNLCLLIIISNFYYISY